MYKGMVFANKGPVSLSPCIIITFLNRSFISYLSLGSNWKVNRFVIDSPPHFSRFIRNFLQNDSYVCLRNKYIAPLCARAHQSPPIPLFSPVCLPVLLLYVSLFSPFMPTCSSPVYPPELLACVPTRIVRVCTHPLPLYTHPNCACVDDLVQYVEEHEHEDGLLHPPRENPFKEKKSCALL